MLNSNFGFKSVFLFDRVDCAIEEIELFFFRFSIGVLFIKIFGVFNDFVVRILLG